MQINIYRRLDVINYGNFDFPADRMENSHEVGVLVGMPPIKNDL